VYKLLTHMCLRHQAV